MSVIKTQGGKVILKGGKPSCTCCEEAECCMYPADTPAGDLPDAITLNGTSLSKSGTSYGDTTDGLIQESGVWARYVDGVRSTQTCLITGDGNYTPGNDAVEDQFADTYAVSATLTSPLGYPYGTDDHSRQTPRLSLCSWSYSGEQEDPGNFTFILNVIFDPTLQKWVGTYVLDSNNFGTAYFIKDGSQNTPVGTYTLEYFYDLSSDNPDDGGGEFRYDYTGTFTVSEI
jgi:hypothetical protein